MTVARDLVRRVRQLAQAPLPEAVEACASLHLLDAVGVGLAAAGSEIGRPYRIYAETLARGGPASVLGGPGGASPADAALVNGGLIHSLEFDDTHTGSIVHGSAVLAAAALAGAQAAGASGERLVRVYALGWEVLIRMGLAAPGRFQARGFQVTSVSGALVAALMAAELSGLDEDRAVAAIGIALSTASGTFEFLSNGSSVKSMHPGWAAHGGLTAAALAHAGLGGPETAIEGRFGLYRAFTGDEEAAERFRVSLADLGALWRIEATAFKLHPCCHYLHPFIEAAGLLAARGVAADEVGSLLCRIPAGAAQIVCEPWALKQAPETGHAARWSLPVAVATRLVEGRVDLATFETRASEAVRDLASRMSWEPLEGATFPERFEAEILCRMRNGAEHRIRVEDAYGNAGRPAARDEILAKFRANAGRFLPASRVPALEAALAGLSRAPDLTALAAALSPPPGHSERITA